MDDVIWSFDVRRPRRQLLAAVLLRELPRRSVDGLFISNAVAHAGCQRVSLRAPESSGVVPTDAGKLLSLC